MSDRQLTIVLVGVLTSIAGGFLVLLLRTPPAAPVEFRLTDIAAETAAGTLPNGPSSAAKTEAVDIEGTFETFDGKPGSTEYTWPHFRGTDFTNINDQNVPLIESWSASGPPKLWSIDLGEGHAGAVVWEGRVFVMDYDEEKKGDALRCFSVTDGKEIWRRSYHAPTKRNHGVSRTVPAVTEKFTVAIGPRCHVMCVDTKTGDFKWGIDMVREYGSAVPMWYTGQCPIIDEGIAVLAPSGKTLLMGVDCETGSVVWQTPNLDDWRMSHSSVMPMTILGKKMYVYCAENGVCGVSAEEEDRGTLLWKSSMWAHPVTSPSPIPVSDSKIFLTAGYGGGSMMIEVKKENDEFKVEKLFELDKTIFGCEQQTPIFYQNHIFGILPKDAKALRGQFACLNTDGELVWSSGKTERFGLGPFLLADGKIFILNDNGELTLIRASLKGYERLAHARVLPGHDAWAPMAIVDGKLILRDSKQMVCLDVRLL